jgi:sugar transferase (PEP-CTERM system associated)
LERTGRAFGFACVGYLKVAGEDSMVSPSRIASGVTSIADFVERARIDEIVVAVEDRRGCLPMHFLIDCRLSGTAITDYATFFERETGSIDLKALQPSWFIFSDGFPGGRMQQLMKRALDLTMSVLLLVFFAPLMLLGAAAVKLESEGPVFYRQMRVGHRGMPFSLLKFRSMRADAERDGVPKWADENDPRITRVGALIRRCRIDELPQILNVLKGDMSFVGPRPERPYFVEQLAEKIPYYKERHWVKPGITGWAQLNYDYGASIDDARKKLQYDLYYIKHYSVFLDLIIILQTIRVIFWPKGVR